MAIKVPTPQKVQFNTILNSNVTAQKIVVNQSTDNIAFKPVEHKIRE